MHIRLPANELLIASEALLLKGKYAGATGASSEHLPLQAKLVATEEGLFGYNATSLHFCRYDMGGAVLEQGEGYIYLSNLIKYLSGFGSHILSMTLKEGQWTLRSEASKLTLPTPETHPHEDTINLFKERFANITNETSVDDPIAKTNNIRARMHISQDGLYEAMNRIEKVGSAVYSFDFDGETLIVGSEHNQQTLEVSLSPQVYAGVEATTIFSAPLHRFFGKGSAPINILFGDTTLMIMVCGGNVVVRAPRKEL